VCCFRRCGQAKSRSHTTDRPARAPRASARPRARDDQLWVISHLNSPTATTSREDAGFIPAVPAPKAALHRPASSPGLQSHPHKRVTSAILLKGRTLNNTDRTVRGAALPVHSKLCCLFGTAPSPSFGWLWTEAPPSKQPYDLTAFQQTVKMSGSTEPL